MGLWFIRFSVQDPPGSYFLNNMTTIRTRKLCPNRATLKDFGARTSVLGQAPSTSTLLENSLPDTSRVLLGRGKYRAVLGFVESLKIPNSGL